MSGCNRCYGTGKIGQVISGQREFGGDASSYSEQPCPECNPQVCPNCKDIIEQLQADLKRKTKVLRKIKNKAWDYTSPLLPEVVRVFANSIHEIAKQTLKENGK